MAFRSFVPYIFMVYALLLLFTLATRFPFFPLHHTFLRGSFDAFMVWPGALAFFFFSLFNSFIFLFSRESEAILSWDRGASQSNKSIYGDRV